MNIVILIASTISALAAIAAVVIAIVHKKQENERMWIDTPNARTECYHGGKQWLVVDVVVKNKSKTKPFTITGFCIEKLYGRSNLKPNLSKIAIGDFEFPHRTLVPLEEAGYSLYFPLNKRYDIESEFALYCTTTQKRFVKIAYVVPSWHE